MLLRHPIIKVVSAVLFIAGVVAMTMGYLGLLGLGMFAMKAGAVATTSGTVGYSPSFWKSSESKNKTPVPSADFDTEMPGLIYNK